MRDMAAACSRGQLVASLACTILSSIVVLWLFFRSCQEAPSVFFAVGAAAADEGDAGATATSGRKFTGAAFRTFPSAQRVFSSQDASFKSKSAAVTRNSSAVLTCTSTRWVVLTTIFEASDAVKDFAKLDGWCTVVVADLKSVSQEQYMASLSPRVIYLTPDEQRALSFETVKLVPWNHFARKNIGFLFAIAQGARVIFDVDDDNRLLPPHNKLVVPDEFEPALVAEVDTSDRVFNPYPLFGASRAWPRGMPLTAVRRSFDVNGMKRVRTTTGLLFHRMPHRSIAVYQSLANHDPDVDAIYRLTGAQLPFGFLPRTTESLAAVVGVYGPPFTFTPYNAQATLHHATAFWGLLLPMTVHGRVSDIWRSYITQRLLWDIGARVAFTPPFVEQIRNAHDYLRDFDSERPLYAQADGLINFLAEWHGTSPTLPGRIEELIVEMYERGFVEIQDVMLTQSWLHDLIGMGYKFPDLLPPNSGEPSLLPVNVAGAVVTAVDASTPSAAGASFGAWDKTILHTMLQPANAHLLVLAVCAATEDAALVRDRLSLWLDNAAHMTVLCLDANPPTRLASEGWNFTLAGHVQQLLAYDVLRIALPSRIVIADSALQPQAPVDPWALPSTPRLLSRAGSIVSSGCADKQTASGVAAVLLAADVASTAQKYPQTDVLQQIYKEHRSFAAILHDVWCIERI